jgi:hypothetical protein
MGFFSDLVGRFVPGPFYTDYQGDYPEDRREGDDSAAAGPATDASGGEPGQEKKEPGS